MKEPIELPKNRYDQLFQKAVEFHHEHPEVWDMFVRFTNNRIDAGFSNYSVYALFERIRWETGIPLKDGSNTFKLNNNHRPFYARWFMSVYPEHEGFFRLRKQISKNEDVSHLPELTPDDFPYTPMKGNFGDE